MYMMRRLCSERAALIVGQSYYESISLTIINYQQQHKPQARVFSCVAYRNYITLTVTCLRHWPKNKTLQS